MRLSNFYKELSAVEGGVMSFTLSLAAPSETDRSDVDVQLCSVGRIEINHEAGEIRFYPASGSLGDELPDQNYSLLAIALSQLPLDTGDGFDPRLMVELPLAREEPEGLEPYLSEICAVHVGAESEEAWLLVRPASEYPREALPD